MSKLVKHAWRPPGLLIHFTMFLQNMYTTTKDSDQYIQPCSLVRVFVSKGSFKGATIRPPAKRHSNAADWIKTGTRLFRGTV